MRTARTWPTDAELQSRLVFVIPRLAKLHKRHCRLTLFVDSYPIFHKTISINYTTIIDIRLLQVRCEKLCGERFLIYGDLDALRSPPHRVGTRIVAGDGTYLHKKGYGPCGPYGLGRTYVHTYVRTYVRMYVGRASSNHPRCRCWCRHYGLFVRRRTAEHKIQSSLLVGASPAKLRIGTGVNFERTAYAILPPGRLPPTAD